MESMKKLLLLLFCGFSILTYSQEQKFKISLQGGQMYGADIYKNKSEAADIEHEKGWNAGVDINYFVTKGFFVGAHLNYGSVLYLTNQEDVVSDTYYRDNGKSSGDMGIENIGLSVGYCYPLSSFVNITGQTGFALFTHLDQYPRIEYFPDERFINNIRENNNSQYKDFRVTASIPVKFSLGVTPFKKLNIGLAKNIEIAYVLGWYIEPDFGFFAGIYHGPQLSISF